MNIGITIQIQEKDSIWKNGIGQNAMMLYRLFKEIDFVDQVYLVDTGSGDFEYTWPYNQFDIIKFSDLKSLREKTSLLVTVGSIPSDKHLKFYKEVNDNKVVAYKGGNALINRTEMAIYGSIKGWPAVGNDSKRSIPPIYEADEVWMVPQQEYHNLDYFEIEYKTKSRVVPFVWSSEFIEHHAQLFKEKGASPWFDDKDFDKWRLVSFEPNMSLLKNMVPILYGVEYAYRQRKDWLEKLIITNAAGHRENIDIIEIVKYMDAFKDGKFGFDGRFPAVHVFSNFTEMVVSNQWGNALNYAYLDAAYFGIPVVHNAHLCQDLGYYYEDFKLKDMSKQILRAVDERKNDITFTERQNKILERYHYTNEDIIKQYALLIKNLWNRNEIDGINKYDWKTNTLI